MASSDCRKRPLKRSPRCYAPRDDTMVAFFTNVKAHFHSNDPYDGFRLFHCCENGFLLCHHEERSDVVISTGWPG